MENGIKTGDLLRIVGMFAVAVAAAWIVQVLEFGGSSVLARVVWEVAAAAIAGGGTGLVFMSTKIRELEGLAQSA